MTHQPLLESEQLDVRYRLFISFYWSAILCLLYLLLLDILFTDGMHVEPVPPDDGVSTALERAQYLDHTVSLPHV